MITRACYRSAVWTVVGIAAILMMSVLFPRTHPWRWSVWDLGYTIPIIVCCAAAVLPGTSLGYRGRATSGLCQSLAFLAVFAQGRVALREPIEVTTRWTLWVILYSLIFATLTHGAALAWRRGKFKDGQCERCGYLLHGLLTARCPECGTPFNPSHTTDGIEEGE